MASSRPSSMGLPAQLFASLDRFWQRTNASDYVGFVIILVGEFIILRFVEPFHRMFFVNDLNISYPFAENERVPLVMMFIYGGFLPLALLILYNLVSRSTSHKHEVSYLGIFISIALASFLTDFIKNLAGRARPDLIDRCSPITGTPPNKLVTVDVCTETSHHKLHEGWRSFPSGHSSFSFAGLGYLSLFLSGQLRIFSSSSGKRDLIRALACLVPLLGAVMIAISRLEDYRHDVYDVCAGSILGFSVAYWSYRRHWPTLTLDNCHEPYPLPSLDARAGWHRIRDEEAGNGRPDVGYEMANLR